MQNTHYAADSLALHLFFGRIMQEHSLFLKAGFTPANADYAAKAEYFRKEFARLLWHTVSMSDGCIREEVISSGEIVTAFTHAAERQTEKLTGIPINHGVTDRTLSLKSGCCCTMHCRRRITALNRTALNLLNGLIALKEEILHKVLSCRMFTGNYPLLLEHIIREAKLYRSYVQMLERDGEICVQSMKEVECFWNQIMMEHALFIRGLLDPGENDLIRSADGFAGDYAALLNRCRMAQGRTISADTLAKTKEFRDFKAAGVQGIENCRIRSLILPLLADHVLREANHYIRLLESD